MTNVPIKSSLSVGGVTVSIKDRNIKMFHVSEVELDNLEDATISRTIDNTLFGVCATNFLTLLGILLTIKITGIALTVLVCVCSVVGLGFLYFAVRLFWIPNRVKKTISRIKED